MTALPEMSVSLEKVEAGPGSLEALLLNTVTGILPSPQKSILAPTALISMFGCSMSTYGDASSDNVVPGAQGSRPLT